MTTRKFFLKRGATLIGVTLLLAGCATPGPLHLYTMDAKSSVIRDVALATDSAADVPTFLNPWESVVGFAYDPFTDHFFLRLRPGNRFRVVDRPARRIKRHFTVGDPADVGGHELALRPTDGHLFLLTADGRQVVETTRVGDIVRRTPLPDRLVALAHNHAQDQLLGLGADSVTVHVLTARGQPVRQFALPRPVAPSLGFDSEKQELYGILADEPAIGVFSAEGAVLRTLPHPSAQPLIDVGPHSFFRMF